MQLSLPVLEYTLASNMKLLLGFLLFLKHQGFLKIRNTQSGASGSMRQNKEVLKKKNCNDVRQPRKPRVSLCDSLG